MRFCSYDASHRAQECACGQRIGGRTHRTDESHPGAVTQLTPPPARHVGGEPQTVAARPRYSLPLRVSLPAEGERISHATKANTGVGHFVSSCGLNAAGAGATFGTVTAFIIAFDIVLRGLRLLLFALACVLFVVFAVDWLVRTRRINPFGPVARFFRKAVDPLIMPVERRIVRAGGTPASAPWWTLVAVVVGGIVLILALQFVRDLVVSTIVSANAGPRGLYVLLVGWTFGILQLALIVRIIASWIRLNPYGRWIRWSYSLTEWLLRPLRSVIPPFGMIDVTPIVAYFILVFLESIMRSLGA